jgi:sugar O-acyltransferase (sialic acid O-acetyltransferase NeuD family)
MTAPADSVFLVGGGGHARVVLDLLERQGGVRVLGVLDDDPGAIGRSVLGAFAVVGGMTLATDWIAQGARALVAIGSNQARLRVAQALASRGAGFAIGVHPAAVIGAAVELGAGTVVMAGVIINPLTRIGEQVIVNTGATVEHDCQVGTGVHLAPGSVLCGGVSVGDGTLIGAGAVVIPGIRIGAGVTVGAGAVVVADVPDGLTVAGCPARVLHRGEGRGEAGKTRS